MSAAALLLVMAMVPGMVWGQDYSLGAVALQVPSGVRGHAMGWSGVADRGDPSTIFFNPANVTGADGLYLHGARQLIAPALDRDLWFGNVSVGGGLDVGSDGPLRLGFDLTVSRFDWGTVIATEPDGTPVGEFDYEENVVGVTAGIAGPAGERFDWTFGAALKRWSAQWAPDQDASEWAIDVGAGVSSVVDAGDWRLRPALGVAAVNLGSDIEFSSDGAASYTERIPTWFNYGVGVMADGPAVTLGSQQVPSIAATMNLDGNHGLNEQRPHWAFGYELVLLDIVSARWGRRTDDRYHRAVETWGVAVGAPVGPVRIRVEYASVVFPDRPSRDVFGFTMEGFLSSGRAE